MSLIKPKFSLSGKEPSPKAGKQFTDREEFLEAFYNAYDSKIKDEHKILVYYGIGGIGKTTLRKELSRRTDEEKPETVWTAIDLDTPTYREQETALFILRNQLNEKYKINFPSFDISYTIYWQKTHPQTPLTKENFPLLTGANVVAGILRVVGEMPYIGFVPKLTKAFMTGQNVFREWWKKRGEKELANLPNLEPKEITERMPMFWANDLKDYLLEKNKRAVIFLDTYEALWENVSAHGGFFLRDEWIRELVSHLPEVLWVICGREKLRWEEQNEDWKEYIEQHLLGSLSDTDSKYFLKTCGVEKEDVQDVIVDASKGVPHFLDLAVDTYYEINNKYNREPETKDFAKTQQEVLERFLRYLDKTEILTLNVLSSARIWDKEIFSILVEDFKTGYPVMNMHELFRFSFISKGEYSNTWIMHDLMRESLQSKQNKEILFAVHKRLFDYYNNKIVKIDYRNINENDKSALMEAYYHGKISLNADKFIKWFINVTAVFDKAAEWKTIIPLYEDLIDYIEKPNGELKIELANLQISLARLYELFNKFSEGQELLYKALEIRKKIFGEKHKDVARILNNLAVLYGKQGKYSEAEPLLIQAFEMSKFMLGENHIDLANSMTNLAILYFYSGKYDKAESFYKKALEIREINLGKDHIDVGSAMNNLATLYFEIGNYIFAEKFYKNALDIYIKNYGEGHVVTAGVLYNVAILYINQGKYFLAEPVCKKVMEIYEKAFGKENNEYADAENNLANLYYQQKRFNESVLLYENTLKIKKQILGNEHQSIARLLKELANNYREIGKFRQAEQLYKKSLEIYGNTIGKNHIDVADTVSNLGQLYSLTEKFEEAEKYFKESLEIYKHTVTLEHPDAAKALNNLGVLYGKQSKYEESLKLLYEALVIYKKKLGENNPNYANTICNIAIVKYYKDEIVESEKLHSEALNIRLNLFGEGHPDVATSYNNLALIYVKQGKLKEAEEIYKKIIKVFQDSFGDLHLNLADALLNFAELYKRKGESDKATELYGKALEIYEKILEPDHPTIKIVKETLNSITS